MAMILLVLTVARADQWIQTFPHAFDNLCDTFINTLEATPPQFRTHHTEGYRSCWQVSLDHHPNYTDLRDLIATYFGLYKNQVPHHGNLHWATHIETPTVIKYEPGTDRFIMHVDAWNSASASRVISIIIYLNDVEDGGVTVFPNHNVTLKPERGTIVMFPSSMTYPHEATVPISGNKYVIVTWLTFEGAGYTSRPLY